MDPQQSSGQFNPGQYDFIVNNQQPKRSLLPSMGSGKQRILFFIIAGALLLIILLLIFSLFTGGGSSREQLVSIAKQQTELVRVADVGVDKATSADTKSLAISVQLAIISDKNTMLTLIDKNGDKPKDKELNAGKNSETDEKLTQAQQNGTFDVVFTSTINELLDQYQASLSSTYEQSSGKVTKETLAAAYDNAKKLSETVSSN